MAIFMHKPIEKDSNTIVCVDAKIAKTKRTINGVDVWSRSQAKRTFGLLCLVDEQGNILDPRELKLSPGDEIPGFEMSDNPVLDRESKEETGLFWVEAV